LTAFIAGFLMSMAGLALLYRSLAVRLMGLIVLLASILAFLGD
jgi:hypothetical protein